MHNCIDEIEHYYTILRPNGFALLHSFMELENENKSIKSDTMVKSCLRDLDNNRMRYLNSSKNWHLD